MGLPARTSFRGLGGKRRDVHKVTNPETQVSGAAISLCFWQVAGMNRVSPLVTLTLDADGERVSGAEAWNSEDAAPLRVLLTHDTVGQYQVAAAATYPDENGIGQAVEFHGAIVTVLASVPVIAVAVLDSATQVTVYLFDPLDSYNPVDAAMSLDIK